VLCNAGGPLWSTAGQQHCPNVDSFGSSLGHTRPFDSPALVTVLSHDSAVAGTPYLPLDAVANGIAVSPGDVTSLYRTQLQQQRRRVDVRAACGGSVTATATCLRLATTKSCGGGADFYRLRRLLRRARRQAAGDGAGRRDADVDAKVDDGDDIDDDAFAGRYPLYCVVCRVRLNAQLQAKQHYKGRSHARRVRLLYGAPAFTAGTASDPAFNSTAGVGNDAEVSSVCTSVLYRVA